MTELTETCQVLAADSRGRVRVSAERRDALLAVFDRSGMSAARFASWAGLRYPTFAGWVLRRRRRGSAEKAAPPGLQWVEAVIDAGARPTTGRGTLVVHLPAGARMEIGDAQAAALAAEVLRSLSGLNRSGGC